MRKAWLLLLGILLVSSAASAQVAAGQFPGAPGLPPAAPRDVQPKIGTARIRGRILAADTGQPLRKARVRAISPELRENRLTTTDRDGVYELIELPAGRYQLTASKGSFVQLQYGQTRPFEAGKPIEVADGQTLEKMNFSLPRGSLIVGRVIDEFGEPATDVQASALRYQFVQGRRQLVPPGRTVTTNDIGEYRVSGLPPGEYFLAASPRGMGFGGPGIASTTGHGGGTPTTTTTYSPGTADQAGAQAITVAAGAEVSNIVFMLQSVPAYRVSGIVVDENGAPIAHAMVMLMNDPRSGTMFIGPGGNAQTGDDGRFSIGDVTPGAYRLNASVPMMMPSGGGIGASSVATGGGSFTSWSISSGGVTTTSTVNATTQPQEVIVADADVKGVRVLARRPPTPQ